MWHRNVHGLRNRLRVDAVQPDERGRYASHMPSYPVSRVQQPLGMFVRLSSVLSNALTAQPQKKASRQEPLARLSPTPHAPHVSPLSISVSLRCFPLLS